LVAVKASLPSSFDTDASPEPAVTDGPVAKTTRTPSASAATPSVVPIGCGIRFFTVTSKAKVPVPPS